MFLRTESFGQFLRLYPVTAVIAAIHIALFLVMAIPFLPNNWVLEQLAGVNLLIAAGEYWRLVTPIFVHAGFAHLLFNSFSLILFAPALERALGKLLFIVIYITCGFGANLATYLLKPLYYSHVGASGSIFGLFGIYLAITFLKKDMMPQQGRQVILPIAALGVIMTFFQSGVNVTAHIFGLITGFVLGALLLKIRPFRFH